MCACSQAGKQLDSQANAGVYMCMCKCVRVCLYDTWCQSNQTRYTHSQFRLFLYEIEIKCQCTHIRAAPYLLASDLEHTLIQLSTNIFFSYAQITPFLFAYFMHSRISIAITMLSCLLLRLTPFPPPPPPLSSLLMLLLLFFYYYF